MLRLALAICLLVLLCGTADAGIFGRCKERREARKAGSGGCSASASVNSYSSHAGQPSTFYAAGTKACGCP